MKLKSIYGSTHYRISDADAGKLARAAGKPLPGYGRELRVALPSGQLAWLRREHYPKRLHADAPKREWIWIVWDANALAANTRRAPADYVAAGELKLYIDNDRETYEKGRMYRTALAKRMEKGTFNLALAAKGFGWIVEEGAKRYTKEFGGTWHSMFSPATRAVVAKEMAQEWYEEYRAEHPTKNSRRKRTSRRNGPALEQMSESERADYLAGLKKPALVSLAVSRGLFKTRAEAKKISSGGLFSILHADGSGLITKKNPGRKRTSRRARRTSRRAA